MTVAGFAVRQAFYTAALFAFCAAVADVGLARAAVRLDAVELLRVLATSAAWAVIVATAATAALIVAGLVAAAPFRGGRARIRAGAAGAAAPVAAGLVVAGLDLLSGPGISGKPWVGWARGAWVAAAIVGPLVVSQAAVWTFWPADPGRRRLRGAMVFVTGGTLCVAPLVDYYAYPRLYPVAHVALWLVIFVATGLIASVRARAGMPRVRGVGLGLAALLVASVVTLVLDPLSGAPVARAAAYRETLFLKRALAHLRRPVRPAPLAPDPAVREALRTAASVDAALLDRIYPDRRRMNVIVISMDALRPDRLSRNGYRRPLTPNLDALLATGTYFTRAWTTYPFTLMAFGSAFRGVYASATDGWRYREAGHASLPWTPQPTLAAVLGARGWRTEAAVGFPRFVREALAREEGFHHFNAHADPRAKDRSLLAEEVTSLAIDALDRDPGRPFLLWVHYFDPHAPYQPPERPFGDAPQDLYDAEILYADRELGRFLAAVSDRGLLATTAIVFFADHGEDLVSFDHGTELTEINVHVPLGVVLPRATPRASGVAADLTDVAATVLDLLGVATGAPLHGQSLLSCALLDEGAARAAFPPDLAFTETGGAGLPQPRQFAAREGDLKIICHADSQTYALFDLAADPGETRDVARELPDALARMRGVLDSFLALVAETPRGPASAGAPK